MAEDSEIHVNHDKKETVRSRKSWQEEELFTARAAS